MFATTMTLRIAWACLCAALCMGCTASEVAWDPSATDFPLAYFHDDCAPWDGPALTIVLGYADLESPFEARFPSVRVTSFRPPNELVGGSFEWTGVARDIGHATWCESADVCVSASTVRVRFDGAQPSADELAGQVHLEFEGGQLVSGVFNAVRLPLQMLCG